jgi:hypothetical protein
MIETDTIAPELAPFGPERLPGVGNPPTSRGAQRTLPSHAPS